MNKMVILEKLKYLLFVYVPNIANCTKFLHGYSNPSLHLSELLDYNAGRKEREGREEKWEWREEGNGRGRLTKRVGKEKGKGK